MHIFGGYSQKNESVFITTESLEGTSFAAAKITGAAAIAKSFDKRITPQLFMEFLKIFAIVVLSLGALILLGLYIRGRKPIKSLILNALSGIAAIAIINLTTKFTGLHIPVNWWSVISASGLGVPAVIGIILLQIIIPV